MQATAADAKDGHRNCAAAAHVTDCRAPIADAPPAVEGDGVRRHGKGLARENGRTFVAVLTACLSGTRNQVARLFAVVRAYTGRLGGDGTVILFYKPYKVH